jgi:hypothetical protein
VAALVNAEIDRTRTAIDEAGASGKLGRMANDQVQMQCACGATRAVPPANVPTSYRCPRCRAAAAEPKERPTI